MPDEQVHAFSMPAQTPRRFSPLCTVGTDRHRSALGSPDAHRVSVIANADVVPAHRGVPLADSPWDTECARLGRNRRTYGACLPYRTVGLITVPNYGGVEQTDRRTVTTYHCALCCTVWAGAFPSPNLRDANLLRRWGDSCVHHAAHCRLSMRVEPSLLAGEQTRLARTQILPYSRGTLGLFPYSNRCGCAACKRLSHGTATLGGKSLAHGYLPG